MESVVELDTGKRLILNAVSAREVDIRHNSLTHVDYKTNENGDILSITFDNYTISIGDVIYIKLNGVKNKPFKVLYIKKSIRDNIYLFYSTNLTKASRWIMPMLRTDNQTQTSMKYRSNFVNCYVGTEDEGYMDSIYLVYRFSGSVEFTQFEQELKSHIKFSKSIDLDHQHTMYIFDMNEEDKLNFNRFKIFKKSTFLNCNNSIS